MESAMPVTRAQLLSLLLVANATTVLAQESPPPDFESCRVIAEDKARLDCLRKLLPGIPPPSGAPSPEADRSDNRWPVIRTPRPGGGPEIAAVMRTADTTRSDPDLAGLMIRCGEKPGFEVHLVLVRPFPPRSKRDVVVSPGSSQSTLKAETSPTGTTLLLPIEATAFTSGPWRGLKEFAVKINDPEANISGVIPLDGIAPALARLTASCASR